MTIPGRVADIMTTDVLTLRPEDPVDEAARKLIEHNVGGAPVVDAQGRLVGLLEDDDLLVQESRLHLPTAISILGGVLEWPPSVHHFEQELRKAVGATVADVMDPDLASCSEDDSVEDVATRLHDEDRRRLPVVRGGRVVGMVARGDILRAMVEARRRQAD
jgi:CBS domain-containing protein